jgi:hypothetical protein
MRSAVLVPVLAAALATAAFADPQSANHAGGPPKPQAPIKICRDARGLIIHCPVLKKTCPPSPHPTQQCPQQAHPH